MKTTSLNELVYDLMEIRRSVLKETDTLDRRQVIDWVQSTRAKLLKQRLDKPMSYKDEISAQDLGTLTLEKVANNDLSYFDGRYMLRTVDEIPKAIETKSGLSALDIRPADKLSPKFHYVPYERALKSGNSKFNYNRTYAFLLGDKVYLHSKSGLHLAVGNIIVRGIFQDPIAAARQVDATWTYDDDYPISKTLVDALKDLIIDKRLKFVINPIYDKIDDREENVEQPIATVQTRKAKDSG